MHVTQQGISIPPPSCLQCRRWLLASTEIDPPRARKYHAILKYSHVKWPTTVFLRCSIVWRQICWFDYGTRFEELMSENQTTFALRKHWSVLNCTKNLLVSSTPSPNKCLVTKLRTNWNVYQVLLYVNSIEKWRIMKNTGIKMPEADQVYVWSGCSYY